MSLLIRNVHLPDIVPASSTCLYNVLCVDDKVNSIEVAEQGTDPSHTYPHIGTLDAKGKGVLLPALCHAHVHLDKCFLLDKCDELVSGDFSEALKVTAKAKSTFSFDLTDLYNRGKRLIMDSVECGVTAMRAHVEVDDTVLMSCLDVGIKLKDEFSEACHVQIAVFAQDPLFTSSASDEPGKNFDLLQTAARHTSVDAVGSAPYIEPSTAHARRNITRILDIAHENSLHADFHLDYNLDASTEPLAWFVLDQLRERIRAGRWRAGAHVCIGHATRLTLFSPEEWTRFCCVVREDALPVTLVGLPPSDMYMMGRGMPSAPRSTLDVPRLAREHGLKVGMAVNNVENAFTPQGPIDPLALCPLGVAVFQSGTRKDCQSLVEAVTLNSRTAIGLPSPGRLRPAEGDIADFVLLPDSDSLYSAALNLSYSRTTIKGGVVVAKRQTSRWIHHRSPDTTSS